ncbi:calcium-dependent kinase [Brachionus plicatilis]|uniref:Calcium-dependent kinase n=1 Tax=Brachionus plicatilis TaxID=10195 RepID=A0A3M7PNJ5_BRAPC|nr:calcium-dependent kinase [Brachionus plicatilis]
MKKVKKEIQMNSQFKLDELKQLRNFFEYLDEDKSGTICLSELKKTCQRLKIKLNENETFELMRLMDLNSNGSIDFEEFVNLIADKHKQEITRTELNTFFDKYDPKKKGYIEESDLKEMLSQFKNGKANIKKIMEFFDLNKNNRIERNGKIC